MGCACLGKPWANNANVGFRREGDNAGKGVHCPTGTVSGDVAVNVNTGASQVKLYSRAAGSTGSWYLITTDTSAPFSINWVTAPYVPNGSYDLMAEAYNGATLVGSTTVRVSVAN